MKRTHRLLSFMTAASVLALAFAVPVSAADNAVKYAAAAEAAAPAAASTDVTATPYYPDYNPWITDDEGHMFNRGTNALWEVRLEIKNYPKTAFAVGEEFNTDGLQVFMIEQRRFNQKDYDVTPVLNIETDYDANTEGTYTVKLSTDYQNGEAHTDDEITYEVTVSSAVTTMSTEATGTVTGLTETTATTAATRITQLTNISVGTTQTSKTTRSGVTTYDTTGDAYGGSSGTRLTTTMIELEPVNLEVGDSIVVDVCEDPDQVLYVQYARDLNPGLISNVGYEYSECYVRVYFHALKTGATTVEVLLCDGRTFLIPVIISNPGAVTTAVTMYVGEEITVPVFTIPYGVEVNDVSIYGDSCINLNRNRMEYDELARALNMHITADAPGQADIIVTLSSGTTFVFHIVAEIRLTANTAETVMYVGDVSELRLTCPLDKESGQLVTDGEPQARTTGEIVEARYKGITTEFGNPFFTFELKALKEGYCGINYWLDGETLAYCLYHVLPADQRPETTTSVTTTTRSDDFGTGTYPTAVTSFSVGQTETILYTCATYPGGSFNTLVKPTASVLYGHLKVTVSDILGSANSPYFCITIEALEPGTDLVTISGQAVPMHLYYQVLPETSSSSTVVSSASTTTTVTGDRVPIRGDANDNGVVELNDVVQLAKAIAGIENLSVSGARSCDLDGKEGLGEGDLKIMIRYFAGIIQKL